MHLENEQTFPLPRRNETIPKRELGLVHSNTWEFWDDKFPWNKYMKVLGGVGGMAESFGSLRGPKLRLQFVSCQC